MRTGGPTSKRRGHAALFTALICGAMVLIGSGVASATPTTLSLSGCASCFGVNYTLEFSQTNSTVNYTLTVDTTGYNGEGSGLDAVAVKTVSASTNFTLSNQIVPPTFSTFSATGLNANGCSGGSGGFLCSFSSNLGGVAVGNAGNIYTWTWEQTLLNGGTLLSADDMSMKALYVNSAGSSRGITSDKFTVPLPGTFLLFGASLIGFVVWHRRSGLSCCVGPTVS